ncbi:MAG: hypothetical protein J0H22_10340, partial [Actinobacteria bacterium]|nr:hypothetical protein [Actinomycetota bacterium]
TLSRIIHLVEAAQASKGRSQRFIERFGKRYSPAVLAVNWPTAWLTWVPNWPIAWIGFGGGGVGAAEAAPAPASATIAAPPASAIDPAMRVVMLAMTGVPPGAKLAYSKYL